MLQHNNLHTLERTCVFRTGNKIRCFHLISPSHLLLVGFSMDAGALIVEFKQWVILWVWLRKIKTESFCGKKCWAFFFTSTAGAPWRQHPRRIPRRASVKVIKWKTCTLLRLLGFACALWQMCKLLNWSIKTLKHPELSNKVQIVTLTSQPHFQ